MFVLTRFHCNEQGRSLIIIIGPLRLGKGANEPIIVKLNIAEDGMHCIGMGMVPSIIDVWL